MVAQNLISDPRLQGRAVTALHSKAAIGVVELLRAANDPKRTSDSSGLAQINKAWSQAIARTG